MADGAFRFQQPGAGQYYYTQHNQQNHHQRHLPRNGSPVNSGRGGYANDTPSPSRSPVSQTSSHNPYGMFNQGHQQGQHVMMNGAQGHQRYMQMNMAHKYQHQTHQQHHGQQNHHHQQNHVGGHAGIGHQHTFSSGTLSNATPHFTPANLHNGSSTNGQSGNNEAISKHWQNQLQLVAEARQSISNPHHHCKKEGVTRVSKGSVEISSEDPPVEDESVERNRTTTKGEVRRQDWDAMDLSGQGLRALSPSLFLDYMFLGKLFIDNNKLTRLHPAVGHLRHLAHLDASNNQLVEIPAEIGMLVNMKSLLLFDNNIRSLPFEIGYLYNLETLGIEGNPLEERLKEEIVQNGTKALVTHLREDMTGGTPPNERDWHILDDTPAQEVVSALSYNILCDKYATASQYGYTPSTVLAWSYRKEVIIGEVRDNNTDIVCLQEVDQENYEGFFRQELAYNDYRGVFWPKSRAKTMAEKEAKQVDGCATFYKASKYILLDKHLIDFANTAINRPDMKGEHDTFNRVMPRDNIAVVTFFENRLSGSRLIVVNAHIYWDPVYEDVKVVQVAILLEQLSKLADKWAKHPPCTDKAAFRHSEVDGETVSESPNEPAPEPSPSIEYSSGPQIPLIICGDFNSAAGSGVYDLITHGSLAGDHSDLSNRGYGNFTRDGMAHPFSLKSAYNGTDELSFTNYTPNFTGFIDYIWYSANALQVRGVLGDVDQEYLRKVPGFPNHHFPSDHLALKAEFSVKSRKERKVTEADFGPQRERRN